METGECKEIANTRLRNGSIWDSIKQVGDKRCGK